MEANGKEGEMNCWKCDKCGGINKGTELELATAICFCGKGGGLWRVANLPEPSPAPVENGSLKQPSAFKDVPSISMPTSELTAPVEAEAIGPDAVVGKVNGMAKILFHDLYLEFQQAITDHEKLKAELINAEFSEAGCKAGMNQANGELVAKIAKVAELEKENESLRSLSIQNLGEIQALKDELASVKKERDELKNEVHIEDIIPELSGESEP